MHGIVMKSPNKTIDFEQGLGHVLQEEIPPNGEIRRKRDFGDYKIFREDLLIPLEITSRYRTC
jgi:TfoX/Sxy family transcriptional regulator of competence genes